MEMLPGELIALISSFLSTNDKESAREVCRYMHYNIRLMDIKVNKMNNKIDIIFDGRIYILNRLRLASLCGLDKKIISDIWDWVNANDFTCEDGLNILRKINRVLR